MRTGVPGPRSARLAPARTRNSARRPRRFPLNHGPAGGAERRHALRDGHARVGHLAVARAVQAMRLPGAARSGERRGPGVRGEPGPSSEPTRVRPLADELGRGQDAAEASKAVACVRTSSANARSISCARNAPHLPPPLQSRASGPAAWLLRYVYAGGDSARRSRRSLRQACRDRRLRDRLGMSRPAARGRPAASAAAQLAVAHAQVAPLDPLDSSGGAAPRG
jgi:hypothetical protein